MPAKKTITKEDVMMAMRCTRSVKSAAQYLGVSYPHIKRFMQLYVDEDSGRTLFEIHKNQCGKGIPKHLENKRGSPDIKQIFTTGMGWESFSIDKIKSKGIQEGYLVEHCYMCGFSERRVIDYKIPLLLRFKDGNKLNFLLKNLELLCYNCYFLYATTGKKEDEILNNFQLKAIETNSSTLQKPYNWELSSDDIKNIEKLGIGHPKENDKDDDYEFVTRKMK